MDIFKPDIVRERIHQLMLQFNTNTRFSKAALLLEELDREVWAKLTEAEKAIARSSLA